MKTINASETPSKISFKKFLRDVVGGTVKSARTEANRLFFYRRFLRHIHTNIKHELRWMGTTGALAQILTSEGIEQDIARCIGEMKKTGVDAKRLEKEKARIQKWYDEVVLKERATAGANTRWAKKKFVDTTSKRRK